MRGKVNNSVLRQRAVLGKLLDPGLSRSCSDIDMRRRSCAKTLCNIAELIRAFRQRIPTLQICDVREAVRPARDRSLGQAHLFERRDCPRLEDHAPFVGRRTSPERIISIQERVADAQIRIASMALLGKLT